MMNAIKSRVERALYRSCLLVKVIANLVQANIFQIRIHMYEYMYMPTLLVLQMWRKYVCKYMFVPLR